MSQRTSTFQRRILIQPALLSERLGAWEGPDEDAHPDEPFLSVPRDNSAVIQVPNSEASDLTVGTWVRQVVEWWPEKSWIAIPRWGARLLARFGGDRGRCPTTFTALEASVDGVHWLGHVFGVELRPRLGWDPPMSERQLRQARGGRPGRCPCHGRLHRLCPEAEPCIGGCGRLTTAHETPSCGYCPHCRAQPRLGGAT